MDTKPAARRYIVVFVTRRWADGDRWRELRACPSLIVFVIFVFGCRAWGFTDVGRGDGYLSPPPSSE